MWILEKNTSSFLGILYADNPTRLWATLNQTLQVSRCTTQPLGSIDMYTHKLIGCFMDNMVQLGNPYMIINAEATRRSQWFTTCESISLLHCWPNHHPSSLHPSWVHNHKQRKYPVTDQHPSCVPMAAVDAGAPVSRWW